MDMTPPTPPDPLDLAARIASIAELFIKVGGVMAMVWGFLAKVVKPYQTWRRQYYARIVREVLAPELETLKNITIHEDGCATRLEAVLHHLKELFGDHDNLLTIAMDNRDRLDETNELLDSVGLASDRRHADRVQHVQNLVTQLDERRKTRRRSTDPLP